MRFLTFLFLGKHFYAGPILTSCMWGPWEITAWLRQLSTAKTWSYLPQPVQQQTSSYPMIWQHLKYLLADKFTIFIYNFNKYWMLKKVYIRFHWYCNIWISILILSELQNIYWGPSPLRSQQTFFWYPRKSLFWPIWTKRFVKSTTFFNLFL